MNAKKIFRKFFGSCEVGPLLRAACFSVIFFLHSYRNIYYFIASYKKSEKINGPKSRKGQKAIFRGNFRPILAHNGPKNFPKNFFCFHILTSIISYLHAKNQKILTIQCGENSKIPYFAAILAQNWPKIF